MRGGLGGVLKVKQKISNLPSLLYRRRELRNNLTPQENKMWRFLKDEQLGCKFRRQHSFGKYIADFYCREKQLIIEIDGSQHLEKEKYDLLRTKFFESRGLRVLRFWNNEVSANIEGVIAKIKEWLN